MARTISKKVCMLGDFSVGKTSLVRRFIDAAFSEKYITTVGVKVDTKLISLSDDLNVKMVLWDIAGEKAIGPLQRQYLKGMTAFLLVVDSTRLPTLTSAKTIREQIVSEYGDLPFFLLVNKTDLIDQIEITDEVLEKHNMDSWPVFQTSAKTGAHVEQAFSQLADKLANGTAT